MLKRIGIQFVDGAAAGVEAPAVWSFGFLLPAHILITLSENLSSLGGIITSRVHSVDEAAPLFWAAAKVELPLDIEIESVSDSHLLSLKDEARRCWHAALTDMIKRADWIATIGCAGTVSSRLMEPFKLYAGVFTIANECANELVRVLVQETMDPDVRIIGYLLGTSMLASRKSLRKTKRYHPDVYRDPVENPFDDLTFHAYSLINGSWERDLWPTCGNKTLEEIIQERPAFTL